MLEATKSIQPLSFCVSSCEIFLFLLFPLHPFNKNLNFNHKKKMSNTKERHKNLSRLNELKSPEQLCYRVRAEQLSNKSDSLSKKGAFWCFIVTHTHLRESEIDYKKRLFLCVDKRPTSSKKSFRFSSFFIYYLEAYQWDFQDMRKVQKSVQSLNDFADFMLQKIHQL